VFLQKSALSSDGGRLFSSISILPTSMPLKGNRRYHGKNSILRQELFGYTLLLVLGSLWSCIPVGFAIILLLTRTRLEDRTLITELAGYSQYIQRTCYKLVPGIW
jgi:hypothetical protein